MPIDESSSLFRYSDTGGCAAKLHPAELLKLISALPQQTHPNLLSHYGGNEDAAVWMIGADTALIATVDVIAPPVPDPAMFGRIGAANALSDVYAMGGEPFLCLAILAIPAELQCSVAQTILIGAAETVAEAGAVLAGGHTVRSERMLFGLAALGTVHPKSIWRNGSARPGDALLLTKPVGMGVLFSALRAARVTEAGAAEAIRWASTSNRAAARSLAGKPIHAATDVTGFGLLGHALEMARASHVTISIRRDLVPTLPGAAALYEAGATTSITAENAASVGEHLRGFPGPPPPVLVDPQTNGGLLVAMPQDVVDRAVADLRSSGLERASAIGTVRAFEGTYLELLP